LAGLWASLLSMNGGGCHTQNPMTKKLDFLVAVGHSTVIV